MEIRLFCVGSLHWALPLYWSVSGRTWDIQWSCFFPRANQCAKRSACMKAATIDGARQYLLRIERYSDDSHVIRYYIFIGVIIIINSFWVFPDMTISLMTMADRELQLPCLYNIFRTAFQFGKLEFCIRSGVLSFWRLFSSSHLDPVSVPVIRKERGAKSR